MAIGERIHFFRMMRGMTQKYLGMALGFPEKSADVRLAQYENGSRTPKADVTAALAQALDVSPKALDVPDIDSYIGLMHTLFTLEDLRAPWVEMKYSSTESPSLKFERIGFSMTCWPPSTPDFCGLAIRPRIPLS